MKYTVHNNNIRVLMSKNSTTLNNIFVFEINGRLFGLDHEIDDI